MTELETWIGKAITHMVDIHNDYKQKASKSFDQHDRNMNMNAYEK
jgi:hypothetical protein